MAYRDIVKPWFETGDKPTQSQFWTLFDYLRFKDEDITVGEVATLIDLLEGKVDQAAYDEFYGGLLLRFTTDNYYDIPAGYLLEKFIVVPDSDINLKTGFALDSDTVTPEETVTTEGACFVVNIFAKTIKRVYFTGITGSVKVIFFKRKVNLV